jgi:hypothetical protein
MSVLETPRDAELSLPEFLSDRARHSSDARLAADAGIGFVVAIAAVLWRGPAWHLITSAAICFLAYGAWGIADRELLERSATPSAGFPWLRLTRLVTATAGFAAALALIVGTLFVALGRIIS